MDFNEGDVVQLASGGPAMTVTGYLAQEHLNCSWFANNKLSHGTFNPKALVKVKTPAGAPGFEKSQALSRNRRTGAGANQAPKLNRNSAHSRRR
jgi:uncharacterized protein YodC (DUF2158 family)